MADDSKTDAAAGDWMTVRISSRKRAWGELFTDALKLNNETLDDVISISPPNLVIADPYKSISFGGAGDMTLFWTDKYAYFPFPGDRSYFISTLRHPRFHC